MKKGSYWFGFLSEKEQEEFKQNFLIQTKKEAYIQSFETPFESYYLELEFEIMWFFVVRAFQWFGTEQGYSYWNEIAHNSFFSEISYRKTDEVIK
jgi:hypothetical protein